MNLISKNKIKSISFLIVVILIGFIFKVNAAGLTNIIVTPASQNQSTLTNVVVTFTPNTAITNSTILTISYDTSFTGGASLVNTDIAVAGTNISGKVCSNFIIGYFTCTLTTTGSVTTLVTVTIGGANQLTTPATAGNYSFAVTADIGGLGSTIDSGSGLAYISNLSTKENEIMVTAYVPPNLSLELYSAGTNTELADPNTCNLGVLNTNSVNSCSYDIGVGTNNPTGASVAINSDGKLRNGLIDFTDTLGSVTAGTESYGFYISTNGARFTPLGAFATAYQVVPTSNTNFASSGLSSDLLNLSHHFAVTHSASISSTTQVGNYSHKIIYSGFTN